MDSVTLSLERYSQLIRSEHDANHFKALISDKRKSYESIPYSEVLSLDTMYNNKEEDNV